jgi:type VI protein secretion system component Hcp
MLHVYMTVSGINPSTRVPVNSANFGGSDPNGTVVPADVVINAESTRFTPLLLKAFVERTTHKVVLTGWEPNVNGVEHQFVKITLTGAVLVSLHMAGTNAAEVIDTLHWTFDSLEFDWIDTATDYIWQVVA